MPQNDFDLTPPEERERRQLWRKIILGLIAVVTVIAALWMVAPRVSRSIKSWQSSRLAREAFVLIDQEKWSEANSKTRDAYQLSTLQPEAWRAAARLLTRTHQSAAALEWWSKLAGQNLLTLDDRREYAEAALLSGDLVTASQQIGVLLAPAARPSTGDSLLAAQLATRRFDGLTGLEYSERVLTDPRAKPRELLSGAILAIAITAPDSPPFARAWSRIEDLARDSTGPVTLDALVFLGSQSGPRVRGTDDSFTASVIDPPKASASMSRSEIADRLERHPGAKIPQRLLALGLRAESDPDNRDKYVRQAIEQFGSGDDESLTLLGGWLRDRSQFEELIALLPLERAQHSRGLFQLYLEALKGLGRWAEVKEVLAADRFPLDPVLQHMFLAVARGKLGESAGQTNEWQRAIEAANTPEKLVVLASFAAQNDATDVADEAYAKATISAPRMRSAYLARLELAKQRGQTARALSVATRLKELWPEDAGARNEEEYLRLLVGTPEAEAEKIERDAQALSLQQTSNWSARATLGLARLRQGRTAAALNAFSGVKATGSEPPGALAVRAAALAANGWKEGAAGDARNLASANLLPEERALIAPLLTE